MKLTGKKLLLLLLLFSLSSISIAKVGDTYSCQMTNYWSTERWWEGEVEKLPLETFSFKREKKNKYGEHNITITPGFYPGSSNFSDGNFIVSNNGVEDFTAQNLFVFMAFDKNETEEIGWFNWVLLYPRGFKSVLAMCKITL